MAAYTQTDRLDNEAELVARAATDETAFELLYDFYFPRIYRYVYSRVGTVETAEDIVSQVFLKAFAGLATYQDRGHAFGAWIYRIATNLLTDHYRRAGRRHDVVLEVAAELSDPAPDGELLAIRSEERERVLRVLERLPDHYQEVLQLRFFAELDYPEIAAALDLTVNNVRVRASRALSQFKQHYDQLS